MSATTDESPGRFTVSVQGRDNSYYFEQGKINFNPGSDNFNGSWFDPLTPFKSNFDNVILSNDNNLPELLDENKVLLGDNKSKSLAKYKSGTFAGQKADSTNYLNDKSIDNTTGLITKVFHAPDGLAYKWKEGIGVFTQYGKSQDLNNTNKVGAPNIYAKPFAGLDIMNVLSLLVVGIPYNYATYFKATQTLDNFGNDPQSKQNAANSYMNALKGDLNKSNALWGNFIPFKNLNMDEQSYVKALTTQTQLLNQNKEIEEKLNKLSDLNKKAIIFGASNIKDSTETNPNFYNAVAEAKLLTNSIHNTINEIQIKNKTVNPEEVFDNFYENNPDFDDNKSESNATSRKIVRKQINMLTRRMSYDVKANEDKNLFIVDDYYDKDYDIAAYNRNLTEGIKLYNNDFTNVIDNIRLTANLLNLEIFCDTQGHIRVRPPQYNRMPSSVFYRMLTLKQSLKIQVFPEFLNTLFTNQLETLKERLEIIEDQIRLNCAVLGKKQSMDSDNDSYYFIRKSAASDKQGQQFNFISSPEGLISDISNLLKEANPDTANTSDNSFASIGIQTGVPKFTSIQKFSTILAALEEQNLLKAGISVKSNPTLDSNVVNDLISRIFTKSGMKLSPQDYLINGTDGIANVELPVNAIVDVFKVTNELADKINERQTVLKLFYSTLKNATEFKSLDDKDDSTGNQMLTPGIFRNSNIPEVFEHMIEDESYDDYGVASGTRYVIKNAQIINLSISENPPEYTAVEVQGVLNDFNTNALPSSLNNSFGTGSGNGLVSALAIDYDMWRSYGFKQGAPLNVPFLSDPNSQAGLYANILLSRNRKNILRGNLTISGNEFMQPGEVVYIEDRGLLFYVNSVQHSISMGRSFTTKLELTYGHTPGEYIPTVMDMIGKLIYKNRDIADMVIHRQDSSGNDTSVGIINRYPQTIKTDFFSDINSANAVFTEQDSKSINNILYTSAYLLNLNNSKGNNALASIELRIYYDKNNPINSELRILADIVKDILMGERDDIDKILGKAKNATIDKNKGKVEIVEIDLDNEDSRLSPSQKAFAGARSHLTASAMGTDPNLAQSNDKLRKALFSYIVDCWIVIKETNPDGLNS